MEIERVVSSADPAYRWVELVGATEAEVSEARSDLGLSVATLRRSALDHRPRLGLGEDVFVLVVQLARYSGGGADVTWLPITVAASPTAVMVARPSSESSELSELSDRLERVPERLAIGPWAVVAAVVDEVLESYARATRDLEVDVDEVELAVFAEEGHGDAAAAVYRLKRQMVGLRRVASPLVTQLERLLRHGLPPGVVRSGEARDLAERLERLVEQMETLDSLLTSVLEVNLTLISLRQNEDMRRISAWAAIGIVPTAMAGVWGMNFRHMPELGWRMGYPLAVGLMVVCCVTLYRVFRRSRWL